MDDDGWVDYYCICCSRIFSNGCGRRGFPISINFKMTSRDVSVIYQDKGEISQQPICRLLGTAIFMSLMELTGVRKVRT